MKEAPIVSTTSAGQLRQPFLPMPVKRLQNGCRLSVNIGQSTMSLFRSRRLATSRKMAVRLLVAVNADKGTVRKVNASCAAEMLGVTKGRVSQMVKANQLEAFRDGAPFG